MRVYVSHYIAGRTEEEIKKAETEGSLYAVWYLKCVAEDVILPREIEPWCSSTMSEYNGECLIQGRRHPGDSHTVPCYLRADFAELLRCDAIVMTKGWETSYGAAAELNLAVQAGLLVHFS